jgi:hypothetical protein
MYQKLVFTFCTCLNFFTVLNQAGKHQPAATFSTAMTASVLEIAYNNAINEKEIIEKKINQAELLNANISALKASEDFRSTKDLKNLSGGIYSDEILISKSAALYHEIDILERKKETFYQESLKIQKEIFVSNEKLRKAVAINTKISEIERNPAFLQLSDIEQLMDGLGKVNSIFQTMSLQGPTLEAELDAILKVQNEARDELECVVCLEVPLQGIQVFSCLEHHLLCSECAKQIHQTCPVCRQNFRQTPPTRNRLAEKMIQRLG